MRLWSDRAGKVPTIVGKEANSRFREWYNATLLKNCNEIASPMIFMLVLSLEAEVTEFLMHSQVIIASSMFAEIITFRSPRCK